MKPLLRQGGPASGTKVSSIDVVPVACIIHPDDEVSQSIAELVEARLKITTRRYSGIPVEVPDGDGLRCVITAFQVGRIAGSELLTELERCGFYARVVLVGARQITIRQAVDAMQSGAVHVLEQPLDEHKLVEAVQEAIKLTDQERECSTRRQLTNDELLATQLVARAECATR